MSLGIFADRYASLENLGQGRVSEVYRVTDMLRGRTVTLKLLPEGIASDQPAMRRFELALRAAARLAHPNIVAVYEYGQAQGRPYVVAEYVPGPNLKDWTLHRALEEGPPSEEESRGLMAQILEGVGHAHAAGVVHGDLKPQDVLVHPEGKLKVGDFGLIRGTIGVSHSPYLAPEQMRGEQPTPQSDVYALGVMLYELLAGQLPSEGAIEGARNGRPSAPRPLGEVAPDVDVETADVVEHAMSPDPDERFRDAGEMLSALPKTTVAAAPVAIPPAPLANGHGSGEPIEAAEPRPARALTIPPDRRWAALLLVPLLALAVLAYALRGTDDGTPSPALAVASPTGALVAGGAGTQRPAASSAPSAIPTATSSPVAVTAGEGAPTAGATDVPATSTDAPAATAPIATEAPTAQPTPRPTATPEPTAVPRRDFRSSGLGLTVKAWERAHGGAEEEVGGYYYYEGGTYFVNYSEGRLWNMTRDWTTPSGVSLQDARAEGRKFLPADAKLVSRNRNSPTTLLEVYRSPSLAKELPPPTGGVWRNNRDGTVSILYRFRGRRVNSLAAQLGDQRPEAG